MIKRYIVLLALVGATLALWSSPAHACGTKMPDPVYGCEEPPQDLVPPPPEVEVPTPPPTTIAVSSPSPGDGEPVEPPTTSKAVVLGPQRPVVPTEHHLAHTGRPSKLLIALAGVLLISGGLTLIFARAMAWAGKAEDDHTPAA
jgi:hypothetical protein